MIIKSRTLAIVMKFIMFAIAGTGTALSLGVAYDHLTPETLNFFTVLSSAIAAVYFLVDGIWMLRHRDLAEQGQEWFPALKHIALLAVLLTGIIANTLLVGVNSPTDAPAAISATLLHQLSPIVAFLDFVLFEKHGGIKATDPLIWCVFPIAYLVYVMVAVGVFGIDANPMDATTHYPYPFFDVAVSGLQTVVTTIAAMLVGYIALGYALFGIDKLIAKFRS